VQGGSHRRSAPERLVYVREKSAAECGAWQAEDSSNGLGFHLARYGAFELTHRLRSSARDASKRDRVEPLLDRERLIVLPKLVAKRCTNRACATSSRAASRARSSSVSGAPWARSSSSSNLERNDRRRLELRGARQIVANARATRSSSPSRQPRRSTADAGVLLHCVPSLELLHRSIGVDLVQDLLPFDRTDLDAQESWSRRRRLRRGAPSRVTITKKTRPPERAIAATTGDGAPDESLSPGRDGSADQMSN